MWKYGIQLNGIINQILGVTLLKGRSAHYTVITLFPALDFIQSEMLNEWLIHCLIVIKAIK